MVEDFAADFDFDGDEVFFDPGKVGCDTKTWGGGGADLAVGDGVAAGWAAELGGAGGGVRAAGARLGC